MTGSDDGVQVLKTGTSKLERTGAWSVSPRLKVVSVTGAVKLDFREAQLPGEAVDIDFQAGTGSVELVLPSGASADASDLMEVTGKLHTKVPATGQGVHFRLHGVLGTGALRIGYEPHKKLGIF